MKQKTFKNQAGSRADNDISVEKKKWQHADFCSKEAESWLTFPALSRI